MLPGDKFEIANREDSLGNALVEISFSSDVIWSNKVCLDIKEARNLVNSLKKHLSANIKESGTCYRTLLT